MQESSGKETNNAQLDRLQIPRGHPNKDKNQNERANRADRGADDGPANYYYNSILKKKGSFTFYSLLAFIRRITRPLFRISTYDDVGKVLNSSNAGGNLGQSSNDG